MYIRMLVTKCNPINCVSTRANFFLKLHTLSHNPKKLTPESDLVNICSGVAINNNSYPIR